MLLVLHPYCFSFSLSGEPVTRDQKILGREKEQDPSSPPPRPTTLCWDLDERRGREKELDGRGRGDLNRAATAQVPSLLPGVPSQNYREGGWDRLPRFHHYPQTRQNSPGSIHIRASLIARSECEYVCA